MRVHGVNQDSIDSNLPLPQKIAKKCPDLESKVSCIISYIKVYFSERPLELQTRSQ